jgi:nitrous oxidase accessory protein NosD
MKYVSLLSILAAVVFAIAASAADIQDAYDACGPAEGYDKYLELNPNVTYTGDLTVDQGKDSCIEGNGAEIYIDSYAKIMVDGSPTRLDVDHVVLYGHGSGEGLHYRNAAKGIVNFCTIDNFMYGVYVWGVSDVTIKNSIITNNSMYGVAKEEISTVRISYVDVWGNSEGNYYQYCSG